MSDTKNIVYLTHKRFKEAISARKKLLLWQLKGKPIPPPHVVKQKIVKDHAARFKTRTLIETGTFMGEMIDAVLSSFTRIISVEFDEALALRARKKFSSYPCITIIHGDSAAVLPQVVVELKEPCLFWLDAHYSGGVTAKSDLMTPIVQELNILLSPGNPDHVILIDDAREFTGQNNYPTLAEVREFIASRRPDWIMHVQDDIIRIHKAVS